MFFKEILEQLDPNQQNQIETFVQSPFFQQFLNMHISLYADQILSLDSSNPDFISEFAWRQTLLRLFQEFKGLKLENIRMEG
jgi:hypothetical protein